MKFTTLSCALPLIASAVAHSPQHLSTTQTRRLHEARSLCSRDDLHCILAHEATEGPFYIPDPLLRSNITEDRAGVPLNLRIKVLDVTRCAPAEGVWVDIWHADAHGAYSGWASGAAVSPDQDLHGLMSRGIFGGGPPGFGSHDPEEESRFLRGVALTDDEGVAAFDTIIPAWYDGRSTHIHLRIHTGNVSVESGMLVGAGTVAHTGQLFFPDELMTELARTTEPYKTHAKSLRPKLNGDDGIYRESVGKEQVVSIERDGDSYKASVSVGVDPEADHSNEDAGMPGFGGLGHGWGAVFAVLAVGTILITGGFTLQKYRQRRAARYEALSTDASGEAPASSTALPAYRDD